MGNATDSEGLNHFDCNLQNVSICFYFQVTQVKLCFSDPPLGFQSEAGVREFHIVQVSSSSQHWRLHKCINPAKDKGLSHMESRCEDAFFHFQSSSGI